LLVVKSNLFEGMTLIVIVWNSVMLALDDPTKDNTDAVSNAIDLFFLAFYTLEMVLKIIGMGFITK
jgi:hypothetical protein